MKIGYLGPVGSFTYLAVKQLFKTEELVPFSTIPRCLAAVKNQEVDFSLVPIENTIEGTVNPTLDYFYHHLETKQVVAEVIMPIQQQLLIHESRKDAKQEITKIYSHPQALAQSQNFISTHFPQAKLIVTDSTSSAAAYVAEHPAEPIAAIAPLAAAANYELTVKAKNIQDLANNETRFWLCGSNVSNVTFPMKATTEKCSICVETPQDTPGTLHQVLACFSWRNINLSKIESRPLKTKLGEYFFMIELYNEKPELIQQALTEIQLLGSRVHILGTYLSYPISAI